MIISPVIGGGYLHITNETEGKVCSITIDPKLKHAQNTSTIFDITIGSGNDAQSIVNINSDGSASFSGDISAINGFIGGWDIGTDRITKDLVGLSSSNDYVYPS
jgi:hypothetical protein